MRSTFGAKLEFSIKMGRGSEAHADDAGQVSS